MNTTVVSQLKPKLHLFNPSCMTNLTLAELLCDKQQFSCQEAFAYMVQYGLSLKNLTSKKISDESNRCSDVYTLSSKTRPLMILKFARKSKYDIDILREYIITKRYLNPLRAVTPNFTYAYDLLPPKNKNGHYKALYEYVMGKDLEDMVSKMLPIDLAGVFIQICLSLQIAMDACLFTHYDLHSSNILITDKPLDYVYHIGSKHYRVKCRYTVKFIDFGYSYAVGSGMGIKKPAMYGAVDLAHAKVHSDIFSTGFDFIKLVGFVYKTIRANNKEPKFKCFDWLWKKYVLDRYKNLKDAKKRYYGIKYSDVCNHVIPNNFIFELIKNNNDLCAIESVNQVDCCIEPPEALLCMFHPVVLGRYYEYHRRNSLLNSTYYNIMMMQYNWFVSAGITMEKPVLYSIPTEDVTCHAEFLENLAHKMKFPDGRMTRKIRNQYVPHINSSVACILRMSQMPHRDWKLLQKYRMYYRPLAYINSSQKIDYNHVFKEYIDRFGGKTEYKYYASNPKDLTKWIHPEKEPVNISDDDSLSESYSLSSSATHMSN